MYKIGSSFIHNTPKPEITQMSTRRRMDKQTGAYPCNGPQGKEKTAAPHDNVDQSYRHYVEQKKPDNKEGILSGSFYIKSKTGKIPLW